MKKPIIPSAIQKGIGSKKNTPKDVVILFYFSAFLLVILFIFEIIT